MKGDQGVLEANGMKKSQIKYKLLLFDESELCFFLFLSPVYINVYFLKPNQIIKWSGLKRTYNLCRVKKAKLEINGSHIGNWQMRGKPQNFKESKLPKGLSAMVSYEKKT